MDESDVMQPAPADDFNHRNGRKVVVFSRHGESEWNRRNLFCGWYDSELSADGKEESLSVGEKLRDYTFDIAYSSALRRSYDSLQIILKSINAHIPVVRAWQLNERHYGDLTGYNKAEMAEKYGLKKVQVWRRSYDVVPPPMRKDHKYHSAIVNNPPLLNLGVREKEIPASESLKDVYLRCVPYWENVIVPEIKLGKRVLVVTHGTCLRGLVKYIDNISEEMISSVNIPNGIPFVYEFNDCMRPVVSMKYLCEEETLRRATEKVASIGHKN